MLFRSQLECINCGLCIDACNHVMQKTGRPGWLITWDSEADQKAKAAGKHVAFKLFRARTIIYMSALTLAAYRRDLQALAKWLTLQGTDLAKASEADLQGYFAHRHDRTKATSANRRMTVFRRFYRWALRDHRLQADPTLTLLSARQPARLPKSLKIGRAHV